MRSRYYVREQGQAHFVTSTIVEWLPVFTSPACCDILVQSLDYCRRNKGVSIYAWVIMENHFHAVLQAEELSRAVTDLKKFTARHLLAKLQTERRGWLVERLIANRAAHKHESIAQVWQEGFHPQAIYSDEVMLQKINYIHANPVRRGWVSAAEHWRYSSAHEQLPGSRPMMRCDPWRHVPATERSSAEAERSQTEFGNEG